MGQPHACQCDFRECVLCDDQALTGLSEQQLCQLKGAAQQKSFAPKEALFREGEPSNHLYILRSGQVKLVTTLADGREQILRLGMPGYPLGFESMDHDSYGYTAEALTKVEVCIIKEIDMICAIGDNPAVCRSIARMLTEELERAEFMIRDLGLKNSGERVATFLLSLASTDEDFSTQLPLNLSRSEIAELLGLTTGTVSRIMAELQRDAIIVAPRGSVRILDPDRLRTKAGIC